MQDKANSLESRQDLLNVARFRYSSWEKGAKGGERRTERKGWLMQTFLGKGKSGATMKNARFCEWGGRGMIVGGVDETR